MIVDPHGNIIKSAKDKEEVITTDLDLSLAYDARIKNPVFRDRRPEVYKIISTFEEEIFSV